MPLQIGTTQVPNANTANTIPPLQNVCAQYFSLFRRTNNCLTTMDVANLMVEGTLLRL